MLTNLITLFIPPASAPETNFIMEKQRVTKTSTSTPAADIIQRQAAEPPFFKPVEPTTPETPEWLVPHQQAAPKKTDADPGGVIYMPDGTRVGQYGKSTQVFTVKPPYTLQQAQMALLAAQSGAVGSGVILVTLAETTTPLGMDEAELFTRAFLVALRYAEADNTKATPYDMQFGGGTFKGKDKNKDGKISEEEKYADHPREMIKAWGLSQAYDVAGAYQFKGASWDLVRKQLGLKDFSPASQDKGAIYLIKEQEKWNPRAKGVSGDITSGNAESAFTKLNGTWTSLPGGKEKLVTKDEALGRYREAIVNELNNKSELAAAKGTIKL